MDRLTRLPSLRLARALVFGALRAEDSVLNALATELIFRVGEESSRLLGAGVCSRRRHSRCGARASGVLGPTS
jgi:hypothetical protein